MENAFTFRCGHRPCVAVIRISLKNHYRYQETIADVKYYILTTRIPDGSPLIKNLIVVLQAKSPKRMIKLRKQQ